MGQGRDKAREWIEERDELATELRRVVVEGAKPEGFRAHATEAAPEEVVSDAGAATDEATAGEEAA